MLGANLCSRLVDTEFALYTSLGRAFKEAEYVLAMLVFLLLSLLSFSMRLCCSLLVVFVNGVMDLLMRRIKC